MNNDTALSMMIEIKLQKPDDFLKIRETLGRIGVSSTGEEKRLYPSVVILHKRGKYYLAHFKTMFMLDGKSANITAIDIQRQRTIAHLVKEWGLCGFANHSDVETCKSSFNPKLVKVVPYQEKDSWEIVHKYTLGAK